MSEQSNKKYQIEHWVRSNLQDLRGAETFNFKVGEDEVTLFFPPSQDQETDGFSARTTVRSSSVLEAENMADDILSKVLNLVAYKRKARARIERLIRSQMEGIGSIRQCVVHWLEKPGVADLWDQPANEIPAILILACKGFTVAK